MKKKNSEQTGDLYNLDYYKSLKGTSALEQRQLGRLPIIDIKGHPFFVNVRIGLLRPKDDFSTMGIEVNKIEMDRQTKQLSFYYHQPTKTQVTIPDNITDYPKDVVMVTVPNIYFLDPYAMAQVNGKDPLDYYMKDGIPLKMYQKAKITPLHKTELAAKIEQNRRKQRMDKVAVPVKIKPKQKKRGQGL